MPISKQNLNKLNKISIELTVKNDDFDYERVVKQLAMQIKKVNEVSYNRCYMRIFLNSIESSNLIL